MTGGLGGPRRQPGPLFDQGPHGPRAQLLRPRRGRGKRMSDFPSEIVAWNELGRPGAVFCHQAPQPGGPGRFCCVRCPGAGLERTLAWGCSVPKGAIASGLKNLGRAQMGGACPFPPPRFFAADSSPGQSALLTCGMCCRPCTETCTVKSQLPSSSGADCAAGANHGDWLSIQAPYWGLGKGRRTRGRGQFSPAHAPEAGPFPQPVENQRSGQPRAPCPHPPPGPRGHCEAGLFSGWPGHGEKGRPGNVFSFTNWRGQYVVIPCIHSTDGPSATPHFPSP